MPHFPLIGRLSGREYIALVFGFFFILLETLLRVIIFFLPKPIIIWFYDRSRLVFHHFAGQPKGKKTKYKSKEQIISDRILKAPDFEELCQIHGYTHEEHVVLTKDGYLLGLHRLPSKKGHRKSNPGTTTGKPVVYLHHGLLMNSEVWVCLTDAERSLPFVLVEAGGCSDQCCDMFVFSNLMYIQVSMFGLGTIEATNTQRSPFTQVPTGQLSGISALMISHGTISPTRFNISLIQPRHLVLAMSGLARAPRKRLQLLAFIRSLMRKSMCSLLWRLP